MTDDNEDDSKTYAIEQNAQNFESIGCAIAVLQRTDSRRMSADVRKMIYECRAKLSLAHSMLINNVGTPIESPIEAAAKAADEMLPGLGDLVREGKLVPDDKHESRVATGLAEQTRKVIDALTPREREVLAMRVASKPDGGYLVDVHKEAKAPPSLGAQLADLRTIIDKVEAARTRVAQRDRLTPESVRFEDVLDLLVDARQTAIDLRDEVERTLAGKFLSLRDLKVGDCFRFKHPPPGWTDGKLQLVEGHPGFAMPEGWDFFPIELLDGEIEKVSPAVIPRVPQHTKQCGWDPVGGSDCDGSCREEI